MYENSIKSGKALVMPVSTLVDDITITTMLH